MRKTEKERESERVKQSWLASGTNGMEPCILVKPHLCSEGLDFGLWNEFSEFFFLSTP